MKTSLKQLKTLIREVAAQAPPDAPLGQYAWPKERKLPVDEKDTDLEQKLLRALKNAITDTNTPLSKEYAVLLQDFIKNGFYSEIFKEPPGVTKLYRGLKVGKEYVESLGGDTNLGYGTVNKELVFKPRSLVSSWSKKNDIAIEFAVNSTAYSIGEKFGIVLEADASHNHGNFIDFASIYKVDDEIRSFAGEAEALGIGDITVNKFIFVSEKAHLYLDDIYYHLINGDKIVETQKYKFATGKVSPEDEIKAAKNTNIAAIKHLNFETKEAAKILLQRIDDACLSLATPLYTLRYYADYIIDTPMMYSMIYNLDGDSEYELQSKGLKKVLNSLDSFEDQTKTTNDRF
jgi:hypothetical protein